MKKEAEVAFEPTFPFSVRKKQLYPKERKRAKVGYAPR